MCRLCQWVGAFLFPDRSTSKALSESVWSIAWDQQYAVAQDSDVIDRDPDPVALREAEQLFRSDPEAAVPLLEALAERGSAWGAQLLGYAYQQGFGVDADLTTAEEWYRRAVEYGCRQAQLRLARIYVNSRDYAEAEEVYTIGIAEGWAPAFYWLARLRLERPLTRAKMEEVLGLLEYAAAQGDIAAQMHLSGMLVRGRFGWSRMPRGVRLLWRTRWNVERTRTSRSASVSPFAKTGISNQRSQA